MTSAPNPSAQPASSLAGLTALITGCSPGINAGIAWALAERGAQIACMDREPNYSAACADWLTSLGVKSLALTGDVSNEDDVKRCVAETEATFGAVDIVVNGAAIETWQSVLESSLDDFKRHLDVILCGAFLVSKYAAESMIRLGRQGSIISLASTEAHQGRPGNVGYGVSKAAVLHLTKVLAMELAPHGIRANSLTPTGTNPAEGDARREQWDVTWAPAAAPRRPGFSRGDEGVPLGQRPSPSDYGHAAAFLASPESSAITGIDLRVDGGVISRYWRWNPANDKPIEHSESVGT